MKNIPYNINPLTNKDNIIYFKDFRISVLKNNLIRIEKDSKLVFNDLPTQIALFRNFNKVDFNYQIDNDILKISLKDYDLVFTGNLETSYIVYNNQKLFLNNDYNLKGTFATVDGMDGDKIVYPGCNREIGYGVCSKNGVAIIDDSASYFFNDEFEFNKLNNDESDVYVFFYPNRYREAVKTFFELSGFAPKLPKYVFGNWWSRFYAYTQEKYLHLMDEFIKDDIPLTIATVDMDWHYSFDNDRNIYQDLEIPESEFIKDPLSKDSKYYCYRWKDDDPWSRGWTGWTFNAKLFSDYKLFLKTLNDKGLKVTLNIHPAQGIHFYEKDYEKCARLLNIDPTSKESVPFDLTDNLNRNVYFTELFNKYEQEGVDFWWIDWQQGDNSRFPGLTPMWLCNHYFMLDGLKNKNRPLILSRFCGIGGHRYPLGFSGDSFQTFNSLKYLIKTTSQASNVGFSYWSHDVGGHMEGFKNGDLYLKFIQFSVFSPILRLHGSAEEMYSKEPKLYLKGNGELIKKYLRLRHKLIPYIYSYSLKTNLDGLALLEPIYYQEPENEKSYKFKDSQYYFANDLLVAPFSNPKDENDINKIKVFFPKENFYDLTYGYKYKSNSVVDIYREQGDMPVFIKEGAFVLFDSLNHGNSITNPLSVDIITTFGNGKYEFLEDDGKDKMLKTTFTHQMISNNTGKITILINNDKDLYQENRTYNFKILNVFDLKDINVNNANISNVYYESTCLEFTLNNLSYNQEVTIEYSFTNLSKVEIIKKQLIKRISYIDDENALRHRLYKKVVNVKKLSEFKIIINESKLAKHNIKILLEMLHA